MKKIEQGAIRKNWKGRVPLALVYPNRYNVAMGNLAVHNIYSRINEYDDVLCERVFLPDDSTESISSIESSKSLSDFKALLVSVSFETDFANIVKLLKRAGVESDSSKRMGKPIVIIGGPAATLFPESLSKIADAVFIGEVDEDLDAIIAALAGLGDELQLLSKIEGMFVPSISKKLPDRKCVKNLDKWPVHTTMDCPDAEFGEMYLVEMGRGCTFNCKYCTVPAIYNPCRARSFKVLWEQVETGLSRGKRIGLVSPFVLSHPAFSKLAEKIIENGGTFSTSSIRADLITKKIAELFVRGGTKTVSIGVEAGLNKKREQLGKKITDEKFAQALSYLSEAGMKSVKLYFMIGLPGETKNDLDAIVDLVRNLKEEVGKGRHIEVVIAPFVPKPNTPFANEKYAGKKYLQGAEKYVRPKLQKLKVKLSGKSIRESEREFKARFL